MAAVRNLVQPLLQPYGVDAFTGMRWNDDRYETQARKTMIHRHLNHQDLSLAAIDDVICRGKRKDWEELRLAVLASPGFLEKIQQVCRAHIADPRAQRYHFWMHYAEAHLAA